jgi:hypothetical protein
MRPRHWLSQAILFEESGPNVHGGTVIPESSALSDSTPLGDVPPRVLRTGRAFTASRRSGDEPYQTATPELHGRSCAYFVPLATTRRDMSTTCVADSGCQVDRQSNRANAVHTAQSNRANAVHTAKSATPTIWHVPAQWMAPPPPTSSFPSRGHLRSLMPRSSHVAGEDLSPVDF